MNLQWDNWHIEPSSICTLKCPRCPRMEVPESLLNRQLSLDFFKNQIGADVAREIKKITFCGNDGDPIYCRDLIDICVWFKTLNPNVSITLITNGSYKTTDWWQYLGKVLGSRDEIHWSLDGWDQASNEQYRVNCDWDSIMSGIQAFTEVNSQTYRVWATIGFKFNQDQLKYQVDLAQSMGFDLHQLTKSTKFGSVNSEYGVDDPLEPTDPTLMSQGSRYERVITRLSTREQPGADLKAIYFKRAENLAKHTEHSGICLIGNRGVFVNSRGEFYPCCWVANRYQHNQSWHQLAQQQFNLKEKTFKEIISDPYWQNEFLRFDSFECTTKCTRDRLSDPEHTLGW